MAFKDNFQKFIESQVEAALDLIFANAHSYAMSTSGDITPEQKQQLEEIEESLRSLVYEQVVQNIPNEEKNSLGLPFDDYPVAKKQKVHVKSYEDDMGTYWKLMFGDETVEDGFESTADAEDWAINNGYEVVQQELVLWNVPVCRIGYGHTLIAVSARTEEEAIAAALSAAGDEEFSENSSEYEAPDGAHLIG